MSNYSHAVYAGLFAFFLLLLWKDMSANSNASPEKTIPATRVGQLGGNIGPTLKVLYCYSCGYKHLFDRYSVIINEKYPDILIRGGNYEPPGIYMHLAKALNMMKMICLICIVFGINIFTKFGIESPGWWNWCMENKIYSSLMIFFLSNAIEGHLISTGAFEIILNDMPVWSKLEMGRAPEPPELFLIIDSHLSLTVDRMTSSYSKEVHISKDVRSVVFTPTIKSMFRIVEDCDIGSKQQQMMLIRVNITRLNNPEDASNSGSEMSVPISFEAPSSPDNLGYYDSNCRSFSDKLLIGFIDKI